MVRNECQWCMFYRKDAILLPNGEYDTSDCAKHLTNDDEDDKVFNEETGHYCDDFVDKL